MRREAEAQNIALLRTPAGVAVAPMLAIGALAFVLADNLAWDWVIRIVALFMLVGIGLTLTVGEAIARPVAPRCDG